MTQLEMISTLVDGVRQLPENGHLRRAIFRAEKRMEVLRARRARMTRNLYRFLNGKKETILESFKRSDQPKGTEHVLWLRVWRYPEAYRPPEVDEIYPYVYARLDPLVKSKSKKD